MMPDAKDKGGDRVDFRVFLLTPGNAMSEVCSQYIDPKKDPHDRDWINIQLRWRETT